MDDGTAKSEEHDGGPSASSHQERKAVFAPFCLLRRPRWNEWSNARNSASSSFIQYLFAYPVHRYQYLPGLFSLYGYRRCTNREAGKQSRIYGCPRGASFPGPNVLWACGSSRNAGKAWYERGFVTSSPLLDLIARWTRDGRVRGSQEGCLLGSCCWYGSGGRRRRRSGRPGHAGHWCAREISRSLDLELGSRCAVCVFGLGLLFFFLSIGQ